MQQGGILLAAIYLVMLFRRTRGLRVFAAVSMLHYGMATTPIVIFLLLQPQTVTRPVPIRVRRALAPPPAVPQDAGALEPA
jgi:hypothetical protein